MAKFPKWMQFWSVWVVVEHFFNLAKASYFFMGKTNKNLNLVVSKQKFDQHKSAKMSILA